MKHIIFIGIVLVLIGCTTKKDNKLNSLIKKVGEKYPEIKLEPEKFIIREIHKFENDSVPIENITFSIFEQSWRAKNRKKIIIITNPQNESYAIPIPFNATRKYWNFELENYNAAPKGFNSSFEKELIEASQKLGYNKSIDQAHFFINQFFHKGLNITSIIEEDSLYLNHKVAVYDWDLPEDIDDSTKIDNILSEYKKELNKDENFSCFIDKNQGQRRVFFVYYLKTHPYFKVKVFRHDVNKHIPSL